MKYIMRISLVVFLIAIFCSASFADNLKEGIKAAQAGDYIKAHELWLVEAEKGNPEAQNYLAYLYLNGQYTTNQGLMADVRAAEKWLLKAADQGKVDSQYNLGNLYVQGPLQDSRKAQKYFLMAAENGHPGAQYNLGYMYLTGTGVAVDLVKAEEWMRESSMNEFADAQYVLGGMYYEGMGVPRSKVKAYAWWVVSADSGNLNAMKAQEKAKKEWDAETIEKGELEAASIAGKFLSRELYKGFGK